MRSRRSMLGAVIAIVVVSLLVGIPRVEAATKLARVDTGIAFDYTYGYELTSRTRLYSDDSDYYISQYGYEGYTPGVGYIYQCQYNFTLKTDTFYHASTPTPTQIVWDVDQCHTVVWPYTSLYLMDGHFWALDYQHQYAKVGWHEWGVWVVDKTFTQTTEVSSCVKVISEGNNNYHFNLYFKIIGKVASILPNGFQLKVDYAAATVTYS